MSKGVTAAYLLYRLKNLCMLIFPVVSPSLTKKVYVLHITGNNNIFDNYAISDITNVSLFTSHKCKQGRRNNGRAGESSKEVEGNANLYKINKSLPSMLVLVQQRC